MSQRHLIGFDRHLDLDWLDYVAALAAEGSEVDDVRRCLFSFLDGKLAGSDRTDSACGKAVRLLSRIWVKVDPHVVGLRDQALEHLSSASASERLALHWALCLAGFHFFGDVATTIGRLTTLQGSVATSQVLRRLYEQWGERSTLTFATQRALRSMAQWGALAATENRGICTQVEKHEEVYGNLALLLVEGLLIYEGKGMPIDQIIRHPAIFPFKVSLRAQDLRQSSRFDIHRQGLDVDIVDLVHP